MPKRALEQRELVLRIFPAQAEGNAAVGKQETHVYRLGLATGKAIPACKQGEWLLHRGFGYWQMPMILWVAQNAPLCETCRARLVTEGILTPVSNTGVNSTGANEK
jgi:hypothetical protein